MLRGYYQVNLISSGWWQGSALRSAGYRYPHETRCFLFTSIHSETANSAFPTSNIYLNRLDSTDQDLLFLNFLISFPIIWTARLTSFSHPSTEHISWLSLLIYFTFISNTTPWVRLSAYDTLWKAILRVRFEADSTYAASDTHNFQQMLEMLVDQKNPSSIEDAKIENPPSAPNSTPIRKCLHLGKSFTHILPKRASHIFLR